MLKFFTAMRQAWTEGAHPHRTMQACFTEEERHLWNSLPLKLKLQFERLAADLHNKDQIEFDFVFREEPQFYVFFEQEGGKRQLFMPQRFRLRDWGVAYVKEYIAQMTGKVLAEDAWSGLCSN